MNSVRRLRTAAQLSQRELALRAGTSQPAIAAYESGRKSPTLRTLRRLATAAGQEAIVTLVPPLTREDRRSLWLHAAIADHLQREPEATLRRAQQNLRRMAAANPAAAPLLDEWRAILSRPPGDIADVLVDPRPHARELRQVTPFGGILSARERTDAYTTFRRNESDPVIR
jgi:transcriptional regulator with XRE-family HTH domain